MAYQNVGTPRFYIDHIQYLKATNFDFIGHHNQYMYYDQNVDGTGFISSTSNHASYITNPELFTLDPSVHHDIGWTVDANDSADDTTIYRIIYVPVSGYGLEGDNIGRYYAVLNHNFGGATNETFGFASAIKNQGYVGSDWTYASDHHAEINILNMHGTTYNLAHGSTIWRVASTDVNFAPIDNKYCFSMFITTALSGTTAQSYVGRGAGALSTGIYYDMPHSPDLKLTMDVEYDGYDITTTKGGSTLTNIRYQGVPGWDNPSLPVTVAPFDVASGAPGGESEYVGLSSGRRTGRRVWKLKFSYLADKDLFPSNYSRFTHLETDTGYDSADISSDPFQFNYTIDSDNSFMSLVWQKTLAGALPFIFQPDNTNNNPDQFCIARFDQKSLKISQVANGVYNISLKIIETW